jgi:heme a synthase
MTEVAASSSSSLSSRFGPPIHRVGRRLPRISPERFRQVAVVALAFVILIVLTGAAVRLSGSGLGCPDWPTCYRTQITPQLSLHPLIEFGNRMVTVVLTVVVGVAFIAALLRRPRRTDLCWLSAGLVAGVLAQAVLGAIVVYTKLNPYVVMVHFLASMLLVADAVVLVHRSRRRYEPGSGRVLVPRPMLLLSRMLMALLAVVLAAGTATTGAGPHAGSSSGQIVKRIPIALRDIAEVHSSLALLLVGVSISLAVALHALDVPERIRRGARIMVMVMVAQAIVGYSQYFTHLPVALVEIHVLGATSLVAVVTWFHLRLTSHPLEPASGSVTELGVELEPAPVRPHRPAAKDAALSRR